MRAASKVVAPRIATKIEAGNDWVVRCCRVAVEDRNDESSPDSPELRNGLRDILVLDSKLVEDEVDDGPA